MGDVVQTNSSGLVELGRNISKDLNDYRIATVRPIYSYAEAYVSTAHDELREPITSAQKEWEELVVTDVESLRKIHANFEAADQADLLEILGVGGL